MISVKTFSSYAEAEIAKGLLEFNDIPTKIKVDDQFGVRPALAVSEGIDLLVEAQDLDRSKKILRDILEKSKKSPRKFVKKN